MASRLTVTHFTPAQSGGVGYNTGSYNDGTYNSDGSGAAGTDISATSFGRSFQETMSDVGSFRLSLQNTDPLLAGITYGDFIRFDVDGTPRFLGRVKAIDTVAIAQGEEHDQVTTISGTGMGEWEFAIVQPPNGVSGQPWTETRVFNYASKELDISGWPAAVELAQAGQGSEGEPPAGFPVGWLGYPLGWSDPTGYWTWSRAFDANTSVPAGTSYFARDVNIPESGTYSLYIAADNAQRLWADGVLIDEFDEGKTREGYAFTRRVDMTFTAGTHRFAVEVTNYAQGLGGFLFALWSQDENRDDDTLILRADTSWAARDYPADPPGFTVGHLLRILLEEAQAAGALDGWGLSFTDTLDSDGVAWPVDQQFSFRVGLDCISVLRQLGASDIDWVADESSRTLYAYRIGTKGVAAAAATAVLDDLSYLEFAGRA